MKPMKEWNVKKIQEVPNQHFPQTQNILAVTPHAGGTSAARKQMVGNNLGQIVLVEGMCEQYIQTGMDTNLADTTFSIKMPVDGQILAIIPRYRKKENQDAIKYSPQTIVIFRTTSPDPHTGYDIGMINLTEYSSFHPYLGFNYVNRAGMEELRVEKFITKGTIFKDSPGVTEEGDYQFSVPINVAMMSVPGVAEDGIIVSRSALKKFAFKTFERRTVEYGSNEFALNTYCKKFNENGVPLEYKVYPEIGERIREDGVLMAMRTYEPGLAIVEQSINATRRIDFLFDRCVFADGEIIDIKIHHDLNTGQAGTPPTMEEQPLKYDDARREFYGELFQLYNSWTGPNQYGRNVRLQPELHRLIVEAISVVAPLQVPNQTVSKVYKKAPLDDYRIEFVIENRIIPHNGNKFTDLFGGKGVVCGVWEDEDMPIDADGNRAEMIFDPASVVNRMIPGRLEQQYINSASRDVLKEVIRRLGVNPKQRRSVLTQELTVIERSNGALFNDVWEYLMGFYDITVPEQASLFRNRLQGSTPVSHLAYIISKGYTVLNITTDHQLEFKNIISDIQRLYPPTFGPVTYRGASGKLVTTVEDVRIGPMPIIMLEKIADGWSAVSSARRQHHGVLATLSNSDKYSSRIRNQPTKAFGETEIRIVASYASTLTAAEILDRNNSITAHKAMVDAVLGADKPSRIKVAVDRVKTPIGSSSSLQMVNHIAACSGWGFDYKPYVPSWSAQQATMVHQQPMMQ